MEKNKHTLSAALRQMSAREPREQVWGKIEQELEREHNAATLLLAIERLPVHEPPQHLWNEIENALGNRPTTKTFITPLRTLAAAVALLLGLALWTYKPFARSVGEELTFEYTHSTEEVSDQLLTAADWEEDAEAFAEISELLQSLPPEAITEEIAQLQSELEELNLAKAELKEAMGDYNTDPKFASQLKDIELERTQLAKQLLRKII